MFQPHPFRPEADHAGRSFDGRTTLPAERAYLLAFFDRFPRGKHEPLLAEQPGRFPGVRLTVGK